MRHRRDHGRRTAAAAVLVAILATALGVGGAGAAEQPATPSDPAVEQPGVPPATEPAALTPAEQPSPVQVPAPTSVDRGAGTDEDPPERSRQVLDRAAAVRWSDLRPEPESGGQTSLQIVLDHVPDRATDVVFSWCLDTSCTDVTLDDDADATLPNSFEIPEAVPGTYVVRAAVPDHWLLVGLSCTTGETVDPVAAEVTVDLVEGEQTTCRFEDRETGVLLRSDEPTGSGTDFTYELCRIGGDCYPIVLDDDDDPTLASWAWIGGLVPGTYTVSQDVPPGWGVTDIECGSPVDPSGATATFDLALGQQLTCRFLDRRSTIRLVHDTPTTTPDDFTYRVCPDDGSPCVDVVLDDDNDPTRPNEWVLGGALTGVTYTVTMSAPGWGVPTRICTADPPATEEFRWVVTTSPGRERLCRVSVTQTRMTVRLDTDETPRFATDFAFTGCAGMAGAGGCGSFLLDDDADPTLASSRRFDGLRAGETYRVTSDPADGWALIGVTCTNGQVDLEARRVTVVLHPGEQASCTFRMRVTSLEIVQDTVPNGPTDFTYDGCAGPSGALGCGTFALDDDGTADRTLPDTAVFEELPAGRTFTIAQRSVRGYPLTALSCSTGFVELSAARATVVLAPGQQVRCTFTNRTTSLRIIHSVDVVDGQDFTYRGCAGVGGANGCGDFVLDGASSDETVPGNMTFAGLDDGILYTVTQGEVDGYGSTGLTCTSGVVERTERQVTVVLSPGEQATCTFTVSATQLKVVVDGSPEPVPFRGCAGPGGALGCGEFALAESRSPTAEGRFRRLTAGVEYTVEQLPMAGLGLTALSCTNGQTDLASQRARVVLQRGEQVTCTFTSVVNDLTVVHNSSPAAPQLFAYTLCGPTPDECRDFSLSDASDTSPFDDLTSFGWLPAGVYRITQAPSSAWGIDTIDCGGDPVQIWNRTATVYLDPGERVTCTFTNRPSTITVGVSTIGASPRDIGFRLCPAAGPCTEFLLDDDSDATLPRIGYLRPLEPGRYTVEQVSSDPAMTTSITCDEGVEVDLVTRRVTVDVSTGTRLGCTFHNRVPTIVVRHDTAPNSSVDVTYTLCPAGGGTCSSVVLDDDSNATRSSTATFADLALGTYTVTQTAVSGHVLQQVYCTNDEVGDVTTGIATITLVAGEMSSCTFLST